MREASEGLAFDLLSAESEGLEEKGSHGALCFVILSHLHEVLAPIAGDGGFRALLGGAIVRTARTHPELCELDVPERGPPSQASLEKALEDLPPDARRRASAAILGEVLSGLARLVGWGFILDLLRAPWPNVVSRYESLPLGDSEETHA